MSDTEEVRELNRREIWTCLKPLISRLRMMEVQLEEHHHDIVDLKIVAQQQIKNSRPERCKEKKRRINGGALLRIRMRLQLTQRDLAFLLDTSPTSINRWERGHVEPSAKYKEKIVILRRMGIREVKRVLATRE